MRLRWGTSGGVVWADDPSPNPNPNPNTRPKPSPPPLTQLLPPPKPLILPASPTHGCAARLRERGEAEVGHLDDDGRVLDPLDEDVLRLKIAVRHAQAVAEGDAAHDLAEDVAHLLLAEARLRVEHVEQVAAVDVPGRAGGRGRGRRLCIRKTHAVASGRRGGGRRGESMAPLLLLLRLLLRRLLLLLLLRRRRYCGD